MAHLARMHEWKKELIVCDECKKEVSLYAFVLGMDLTKMPSGADAWKAVNKMSELAYLLPLDSKCKDFGPRIIEIKKEIGTILSNLNFKLGRGGTFDCPFERVSFLSSPIKSESEVKPLKIIKPNTLRKEEWDKVGLKDILEKLEKSEDLVGELSNRIKRLEDACMSNFPRIFMKLQEVEARQKSLEFAHNETAYQRLN